MNFEKISDPPFIKAPRLLASWECTSCKSFVTKWGITELVFWTCRLIIRTLCSLYFDMFRSMWTIISQNVCINVMLNSVVDFTILEAIFHFVHTTKIAELSSCARSWSSCAANTHWNISSKYGIFSFRGFFVFLLFPKESHHVIRFSLVVPGVDWSTFWMNLKIEVNFFNVKYDISINIDLKN